MSEIKERNEQPIAPTVPVENSKAVSSPSTNHSIEPPPRADRILTLGRPLAVAPDQEASARKLGARFDRMEQAWFAPPGSDWEKLRRYAPIASALDRSSALEEFRAALFAADLVVDGLSERDMDGEIHRVPVVGKPRTNLSGAFCASFTSNRLKGWIRNWASDSTAIAFNSDAPRAERHVYAAQKAQDRIAAAEREREIEAKREAAAVRAAERWFKASTKPQGAGVAYMERKGLQAAVGSSSSAALPAIATFGARFERGNLLLPMFDAQGKLWSVQEIGANGDKKFMHGGRKQGCMAWIGYPRDGQPIALVEGFATGVTVHQALGCAVAVAFDAGNLEPVAREVKRAYPQSALAILGDNDRSLVAAGKANKGVESARAAAQSVDASWAVPHFEAADPLSLSDWNDLAGVHGPPQVQSQMAERLPPQFAPNRARAKARAPQSAPLAATQSVSQPTSQSATRPAPTQPHAQTAAPVESTPSRQTTQHAGAPIRSARTHAHSFAR